MSQVERISLLPWEHNGYQALEPTFRAEVDGRFFVIQLVEGFVRFRELSSKHKRQPSQWNFAIRGRVAEGADQSENVLRSLFEDGWRRGRYGRIVYADIATGVFLGRSGSGFIFGSGRNCGKEADEIPFRFRCEGDFDSRPARHWPEEVEAWNADEESDFHFAFGLAREDENSIARMVCSIGGGGWPEMERIARLILRADARWNDVDYGNFDFAGVQVQIKRGAVPEIAFVMASEDWYGYENRLVAFWRKKAPLQPGALWQAWLSHFVRGFDEAKLRRAAAGKWVRECNFVITDKRRKESAHEQLKALFFLRHWLRDKLPPNSVEPPFHELF